MLCCMYRSFPNLTMSYDYHIDCIEMVSSYCVFSWGSLSLASFSSSLESLSSLASAYSASSPYKAAFMPLAIVSHIPTDTLLLLISQPSVIFFNKVLTNSHRSTLLMASKVMLLLSYRNRPKLFSLKCLREGS